MIVPEKVREKAAAIKLLVCDIDGVLTDGTLSYTSEGELVKNFHAKDGLGVNLLKSQGVEVALISGRRNEAVIKRASDLGIEHVYLGVKEKVSALKHLAEKLYVSNDEIAFVGDDVIDIPVMEAVALSFTVEDGHFLVKEVADWITMNSGGKGAVREIADLLVSARKDIKEAYSHLLNVMNKISTEVQ